MAILSNVEDVFDVDGEFVEFAVVGKFALGANHLGGFFGGPSSVNEVFNLHRAVGGLGAL